MKIEALIGLQGDRHGRRSPQGPMRRIVVRFEPGEVARIDALRPYFPKSSRAAIVRALCLLGASLAEAQVPEAPEDPSPTEGGAS